jgi:hypothetical protein
MDNINKLLGIDKLPPEIVSSIQEAFDKKVEEVRKQTEMTVREEFSRRYDHDKENLVEAMDRMLSDVVHKHENAKAEEVSKFVEARSAFRKAVKESRKTFRTKLDEQTVVAKAAVSAKLKEEISKLRAEKKAITDERLAYADKLSAVKESLAKDHIKRLRKIDEFVVRQVEKEMKEFLEDHKALVTTRARLVAESRKKLSETQSRFVKESAIKVEKAINNQLKREFTEMHEDLEKNRQNMFGRKIFEAFAADYMSSYLAEGTEIRKLQNVLAERESALNEAKTKLNQALKEGQIATRKVKLAEDKAVRTKVLGELLGNLRGEKRQIMERMLETTRTESLRESFNKLLPVVLDETTRSRPQAKPVLNEKRVERTANVVTGGQRSNRLADAIDAEANDFDPDIGNIIRLAGINR